MISLSHLGRSASSTVTIPYDHSRLLGQFSLSGFFAPSNTANQDVLTGENSANIRDWANGILIWDMSEFAVFSINTKTVVKPIVLKMD